MQACNQLNVPSNHKMTTSGSKSKKKTPSLACLKVKNGGKEETPKKRPAKKNLPSPRKVRSGDNIPCKGECFSNNYNFLIPEIISWRSYILGLQSKNNFMNSALSSVQVCRHQGMCSKFTWAYYSTSEKWMFFCKSSKFGTH